MNPAPSTRDELVAFIRSEGAGVIATVDPDGAPEAAYVALAATVDVLVFNAHADSRKIENLTHDARAALVIGGSRGVTVQIDAVATITSDAARTHAARVYAAHLPQFASSADDPEISYVTLSFEGARVCDTRGDGAVYTHITA